MASIHISAEGIEPSNFMPGVGRTPRSPFDFRAKQVCRVRVCSFTFTFLNPEQLVACIDFYSRKIHTTRRIRAVNGDHWEFQRWCDRLPLYLREEPKRLEVVKALKRALRIWNSKSSFVTKSNLHRRRRSEWTHNRRTL